MSHLLKILLIVLALVIVGGLVFLAMWDIPAPTARIEKVIPDERLPK
jgi:hypothetical protein